MKIGVISTWEGTDWGGSEELWATMVEEAFKEHLNVAVSVCHGAVIPSKYHSLHNGVRVLRRRPLFAHRIEHEISKIASPFRRMFLWRPDVVCISEGGSYETVYSGGLMELLFSSRIPYVVVCHFCHDDAGRDGVRERAREVYERAFRVGFVSKKNLESTERQLAHKLTNAIVLRNPVNLADISAVPYRSSGPLSIANIARLSAGYKGQDILLQVLGSPTWRRREWRLRLYGTGQDREYLEALARHYGITERVEFLGHVKDIRAVWEFNHLLALPSRGEGSPLALVEAMLCGRAAVVTDVGGNAEWIEDGITGFVAEAATAKSFGAALERAWLAQADFAEMGRRGRACALGRFDPSPGKTLLKILIDAGRTLKET